MLKLAIPGFIISFIGIIYSYFIIRGFENGDSNISPEIASIGALLIMVILWIVNIILWAISI